MRLKPTLMDHANQNKCPSSFKCLSTIMSSNCSPAFNRWMTGYFTFQQTAAMQIRRMEKKQKFFSNRSKVVAPPKVSFCAEADFETQTETRLAFFNRDEKKRKKRECHFPGMESTFPLYFSSPYFCREWNRDKNRNSRVISFCCVVDVVVVVVDVDVVVVIAVVVVADVVVVVIIVIAVVVVVVVIVAEVVSWLIQVDLRCASNYQM